MRRKILTKKTAKYFHIYQILFSFSCVIGHVIFSNLFYKNSSYKFETGGEILAENGTS